MCVYVRTSIKVGGHQCLYRIDFEKYLSLDPPT